MAEETAKTENVTMPVNPFNPFEPFDLTDFDIRYDENGIPYIPENGGDTGGSSIWPAWAMSIDSNVQGWRTLDNGHLLHKATNKVYGPTGTFVATLADYLAGIRDETGMNPEGPPSNGHPGAKWTDPETGEKWEYLTNLGWVKTTADPKNPNQIPNPTEGGLGPEGTLPPGAPDPGDGPVPGKLPAYYDDYIGLPPPTGSSTGGGGGMANPMPGMPTAGVRGVPPHLAVNMASGTPVGQQEAFKPWGQPLGYLSQALRYGGTPSLSQQDGYAGMEALAAALRGDS